MSTRVRDTRPAWIVVDVLRPERCADGEVYTVRSVRVFPQFLARAAFRFRDYARRRYGAGSVFVSETD